MEQDDVPYGNVLLDNKCHYFGPIPSKQIEWLNACHYIGQLANTALFTNIVFVPAWQSPCISWCCLNAGRVPPQPIDQQMLEDYLCMGVGPGIVHAKSWRIWHVGLLPATLNLPNGINKEAGITASHTTALAQYYLCSLRPFGIRHYSLRCSPLHGK
jgi:hypothetical protein